MSANLVAKPSHIALVISGGAGVTACGDGQHLGSKALAWFGLAGSAAWIGGLGTRTTEYLSNGTIAEVAVYSRTLPEDKIPGHEVPDRYLSTLSLARRPDL